MKKVNAVLGFTRLDEMDRVNDVATGWSSSPATANPRGYRPPKTAAKESSCSSTSPRSRNGNRRSTQTALWAAHRDAHRRNFRRRFSETAKQVDPDSRLPAPRYWLLHTLSHVLIREMAMSCGYGAASLTERIYGWPTSPQREGAAGLLICTTASDSEGTLGGLVALVGTRDDCRGS